MNCRDLHIVSFNVPLPADYGGVIDVYYRLRALAEAGVRVHLHCFDYGRGVVPELERHCAAVHYYRRDMSPLRMLGKRPFIVSSRDSRELRQRLMQDRHPILLEGLHCCAVLEDEGLCEGRMVMVRAHNVEGEYYRRLAASERRWKKRLYLKLEARKIARYEPTLRRADAVLAVSEGERATFEAMGCRKVVAMSSCHPYSEVVAQVGTGGYALYHGALDVAENARAAEWLIDNVASAVDCPLVLAGARPPGWLRQKVGAMSNVRLVADPSDAEMQQLIVEAQVCLLVTDQPTGLKLKLLNSLFAGRHCLVNSAMVAGTTLGGLCTVADGAGELREALVRLMRTPFSGEMLEGRRRALQPLTPAEAVKPIYILLKKNI